MAAKKTEKTPPIDLFQEAMKSDAGEPAPATLYGIDFNIRRDYTGDEVYDYISLFREDGSKPTIKEQIDNQLKALTDLADDKRAELVDKLLGVPIVAAQAMLIKIGQVAGLRSDDTAFLTGVLR